MSSAIKQLYQQGAIPAANWTIIIYLNGESDLLDDVKRNYNQVAKFGSELGKVNFLVIFDGLKVPAAASNKAIAGTDLPPQVFYVSRFERFTEAEPLEEFPKQEDLTKPGNLSHIIDLVKKKFPAKKYGFIYNGHAQAGGPSVEHRQMMVKLDAKRPGEKDEDFEERMKRKYQKDGWKYDGSSEHIDNPSIFLIVLSREGNERFLTYEMMGKELLKSGFSRKNEDLGFVCLDCCWGQTFEAALCFRDSTRYLIASPDEAALLGIGYDDFAEFLLKKQNTIRYDELANNLVGIYFKHNYDDYLSSDEFKDMGVSLSCVDLGDYYATDEFDGKLDDAIIWKMDNLANYLSEHINELWWVVSWARKKCVDYTYQDNPDEYATYNIDFLWFLENLMHYNWLYQEYGGKYDPVLHAHASRLIMEVSMRLIKSNMASNYKALKINSTTPQLGGKGMAITFPADKDQFELSIYGNGAFSGNKAWRTFLKKYVALADNPPFVKPDGQPADTKKWKGWRK
ncbi:MAG: hypothetical protein JNM88_21045 [Chitinophagaceae bacterium]|nr:hypothetical protein [Chitinophagaceae bacterium]